MQNVTHTYSWCKVKTFYLTVLWPFRYSFSMLIRYRYSIHPSFRGVAWPLASALAVAVLTRLLFHLWSRQADPLFAWPTNDEAYFLQHAIPLARAPLDAGSWSLPFWQPPGCLLLYAFLVALHFKVTGMVVLQQLLGVLTTLLLYGLARDLFPRASPWRATGAAALYSLCPALLFYETKLLKPVWILFLLVAALWVLGRPWPRARTLWAGLLLGALVLVEGYFVALVPVLAWRLRARRADALALLAACALVVLPVVLANSRAAGRPLFVSSNGGINLYLGNNPRWTDTYNTLAGWRWADLVHRHGTPSHRADPLFAREVASFAWHQPLAFARNLAAKTVLTLSHRELPRDIGVPSPAALLPWAQALNALALAGLAVVPWRLWRRHYPLLALATLTLLVNVLFFPTSRYRLPLLPVAFLLLAHVPFSRPRLAVAALLMLGSMTAGAFASRWVDYDAWAAFREKEIGMRCMAEQRQADAGRHFEAAVAHARILETVQVLAHYRQDVEGDLAGARDLFLECTRLEPRCPDPCFDVGELERRAGRRDSAIAWFSRYLELRDLHRYADTDDADRLARARQFLQIDANALTDLPRAPRTGWAGSGS